MSKCFWCEHLAVTYNEQKIPTCKIHKRNKLKIDKCPLCKGFIELKNGKYGAFFVCDNCGCLNLKKIKEMIL